MTLSQAWIERCKLIAESDKLIAEADKLWAESYKLRAKGFKLRAKGNSLWNSAVLSALGPNGTAQRWMCDGSLCLLSDGSLWKVPFVLPFVLIKKAAII